MQSKYKNKYTFSIILLFCASAVWADVSITLAPNSDDSMDSEYPAGNKPAGGASCSTWTCAQKGDAAGEINEVSSTALDITANSTSTLGDIDYGHQLHPDTGDIQVKARIPANYTGYTEPFTGSGVGITEGTGDNDYFAQCWCPVTGGVRYTTGTPATNSTEVGAAGSCFNKYLALTYDQSANQLLCMESTDDITYTQVGAATSRTLSCTSNCPAYGWATSGDLGQSTFVSLTNASTSTTISVVPTPPDTGENLVWTGDFDTCDFTQYHRNNNVNEVIFPAVPTYGRPIQYGNQTTAGPNSVGNGDLLEIVSVAGGTCSGTGAAVGIGEVRQGTYAAQFTIKNSANDSEPADCDPQGGSCGRRRTQLDFASQAGDYEMFPLNSERWFSFSIHIASSFVLDGSKTPITLFGVKAVNQLGSSIFNIGLSDSWGVTHRWDNNGGVPSSGYTWQHQMTYTGNGNNIGLSGCYPRTGLGNSYWPDGAAHYPNENNSCSSLQSVNVGGWTDFIYHVILDPAPAGSGGAGIIEMWKRDEGSSWVKVLNITPGTVTRGGLTFDHGIGYNESGGFGPKFGPYAFSSGLSYLLDQPQNSVFTIDNVRVGDENATFQEMTPDGSSP